MLDNSACFLDNIQYCSVPKLVLQDKIYGREEELLMLDELFKHHMGGRELNGTIISAKAGVGKSKLVMHLQKLTLRYLLGEMLRVISSISKPITIVIDDIQFADHASFILALGSIFVIQRAIVFHLFCFVPSRQ
jgi:predicted ATPase